MVSANFNRSRSRATRQWLLTAMRSPTSVIFGQELPSRSYMAPIADQCGFAIVWPTVDDPYRPHSALLVDRNLEFRHPAVDVAAIFAPFRTYVAAAVVDLPQIGETLCVSVHASPNPVSATDRASWPWPLVPPRSGSRDGRYVRRMGELFYSDLMLEALRRARSVSGLPVLAAGDLNEARQWDADHRNETWGSEFFETSVPKSGLQNVTWDLWRAERRTRFHRTQPPYQLDVFLASPPLALEGLSARVDEAWVDKESFWEQQLSDHAPVWLSVGSS